MSGPPRRSAIGLRHDRNHRRPRHAGVAVASPPGPDAVLLRICLELDELRAEPFDSESFPSEAARVAAIDVNCRRWDALMHKGAAIPAVTLDGVRAKARALGVEPIMDLHELAFARDAFEIAMWKSLSRGLVGVSVLEDDA